MPVFLMRFSYTPETWSRLIQNPEDRRDAARAYIEKVGGALHGFWYGFGEYDGYAIFEAPDNVSVAGAVLAIAAGGALASVETTVLMTVEETLEALVKSKSIAYPTRGMRGERRLLVRGLEVEQSAERGPALARRIWTLSQMMPRNSTLVS